MYRRDVREIVKKTQRQTWMQDLMGKNPHKYTVFAIVIVLLRWNASIERCGGGVVLKLSTQEIFWKNIMAEV